MGFTAKYIKNLTNLKAGDLGKLRKLAGLGLDKTVDGFDLFAGLWWPLRQKSPSTPKRKIAWLIAKLYAFCRIENATGAYFVSQLRKCEPFENDSGKRFRKKFDELLLSPIENIEPQLQWALKQIAALNEPKLDWVKLTDDLSIWDRKSKRLEWAEKYLEIKNKQNIIQE